MESWLSIPEKSDTRKKSKRYEWKKQLVVASSRKIFFYNTEQDKVSATPSMILDIWYFILYIMLFINIRDSMPSLTFSLLRQTQNFGNYLKAQFILI